MAHRYSLVLTSASSSIFRKPFLLFLHQNTVHDSCDSCTVPSNTLNILCRPPPFRRRSPNNLLYNPFLHSIHRHFDQSSRNTHTIRADTYKILSLLSPQSPPPPQIYQDSFFLKNQSNNSICPLSIVCRSLLFHVCYRGVFCCKSWIGDTYCL